VIAGISLAVAIASVLMTGAAIVYSLRGVRQQLWLQTFSKFTARYNSIVGDFPSDAWDPYGTFIQKSCPRGSAVSYGVPLGVTSTFVLRSTISMASVASTMKPGPSGATGSKT